MRPLLHRGRWPFAAFALTLAHLACFWGAHVLRAPDAYMFNTDGDGLKNYFTVAWHVKHDTSLFQFAGMNHPFGEQIDYADAQPLLANTLHAIAVVLPALADHTVGVVNLFVVLGFAAAGLFLFLCLVELGCSRWPALLLAIGLAVLSPQTMRSAMSHYSLATPWVLPAAVWLYLRLRRSTRQLPWALALAALLFVLYRHHGYLAAIVTAWLGIRWCLGCSDGAIVHGAGCCWARCSCLQCTASSARGPTTTAIAPSTPPVLWNTGPTGMACSARTTWSAARFPMPSSATCRIW